MMMMMMMIGRLYFVSTRNLHRIEPHSIWCKLLVLDKFLVPDSWACYTPIRQRLHDDMTQDSTQCNWNKKAMLSQRWPRDAPYIWMPWKNLGVPGYAHGYFSRNC